jgi:hypothetical protein
MAKWETLSEEASIVLTGHFNPKIFHPEWFINKEITPEWDYSDEKVENQFDRANFSLYGSKEVDVFLNRFLLKTKLASEFENLKDITVNTFNYLKETPIFQMGMNYTCDIKFQSLDVWMAFGREFANVDIWKDIVSYIGDLSDEKQLESGLLDFTMHLPRPDGENGFIIAKISCVNLGEKVLSISFNNHIEIPDHNAINMIKLLNDNWSESLSIAKETRKKIMQHGVKN